MSFTQSEDDQIKRHCIRNALAKRPTIEAALAKLTAKIAASPKDHRVDGWKARCVDYKAALDAINKGSYLGANDKPFGAVPGVSWL